MLSLALAAALAAAAPSEPPPPPSAPAPDPMVCHVEPLPGSRISQKVCMRASEAARRKQEARLLLDRAQSSSETPHMATLVPMGGAPGH